MLNRIFFAMEATGYDRQISVDFTFHVVVYPAPDLQGVWIAHCLELDLVTQGSSEDNARAMFEEAFETMLIDNLEHGLPPVQFTPAPEECWTAVGLKMPDQIAVTETYRRQGSTDVNKRPGPLSPKIETIRKDLSWAAAHHAC